MTVEQRQSGSSKQTMTSKAPDTKPLWQPQLDIESRHSHPQTPAGIFPGGADAHATGALLASLPELPFWTFHHPTSYAKLLPQADVLVDAQRRRLTAALFPQIAQRKALAESHANGQQKQPQQSTPRSFGGGHKELSCGNCRRRFDCDQSFQRHIRTRHLNGCDCPICGKSFSRHWLLQGHIRTHTGEKPFECPICSKAFADKSNLRAHIQTHSGVKPYACQRCGKSFALRSYLTKHEESSCLRSVLTLDLLQEQTSAQMAGKA